MLPKMSEEKTEATVAFISTNNEVLPPPKSRYYRRYVIIAVTGILMAAIILAAILTGMYFLTEAHKEIVKFSYNRDENTKEDVTSDPNTNIVQFHVNSPDYELWVVDDFNRDIQVMKMKTNSGTHCYVAPLNRTVETDPSKIRVPPNPKAMKQNESITVTYLAAKTPIPDSSFLCKAAKDACKGISTYWVYSTCEMPANPLDSSQRHKRCEWKWVCSVGCYFYAFCFTICEFGCY